MSSTDLSPGSAPVRRRRGWLAASISLNLLLVGLILAWIFGMPPHRTLVSWQRELIPSLSASDAAIVDQSTQRIADAQADGGTRMHAGFARLRGALATQPFDRAAVEQIMDEMNRIRDEQQSAIGHALLDEVTALSPEGRATLLAAMERESRHWRPPGH